MAVPTIWSRVSLSGSPSLRFSGNGEYGNPGVKRSKCFCARRGAIHRHLTYPAEEIDKERGNDWGRVNKKGPQDTDRTSRFLAD
jgi:hypothetical protein